MNSSLNEIWYAIFRVRLTSYFRQCSCDSTREAHEMNLLGSETQLKDVIQRKRSDISVHQAADKLSSPRDSCKCPMSHLITLDTISE